MDIDNNQKIICFGETLWDVFPDRQKPGGAPLNVAVHLRRFGYHPVVISKIGDDELGMGLLDFMKSNGLETTHIQTDKYHQTGVVNVKVSNSGDAKYDIVFPSAWDFIEAPEDLKHDNYILIFGSLASRNIHSKDALLKLLEKAKVTLFDVNFRSPHYNMELIKELLLKSNIVKLNEDEIEIIGTWLGMEHVAMEDICKKLTNQFKLDQIIVTLGSKGAVVFNDNSVFRHGGFKVKVADTVGSGDSFLASYLAHFIKEMPIDRCLEMACATGAYVATQIGAVPNYEISDLAKIRNLKL